MKRPKRNETKRNEAKFYKLSSLKRQIRNSLHVRNLIIRIVKMSFSNRKQKTKKTNFVRVIWLFRSRRKKKNVSIFRYLSRRRKMHVFIFVCFTSVSLFKRFINILNWAVITSQKVTKSFSTHKIQNIKIEAQNDTGTKHQFPLLCNKRTTYKESE